MKTTLAIIKKLIFESQSIILSTHKEPDGDGLGSQIALYHALKKLNKQVRILNVDNSAAKYEYLKTEDIIQTYLGPHDKIENTDLVLILDTNDKRLVAPLYPDLQKSAKKIIFIDHHPILQNGPSPTELSVIETKAASTGEIVYNLIKELGIQFDKNIAEAIYTSLVFDTHLFRFIRNSPNSHLIAADLLNYKINPEKIHRAIFGDFTKNKLMFIAKCLNSVEFFDNDQVAYLKFLESDLKILGLTKDHTRDLIDMIMNIDTIEAALVVREISPNEFKLSYRSKGHIEVLKIAESFNGGGHLYASGAFIQGDIDEIKRKSLQFMSESLIKKNGTK